MTRGVGCDCVCGQRGHSTPGERWKYAENMEDDESQEAKKNAIFGRQTEIQPKIWRQNMEGISLEIIGLSD